MGIQWEDNSNSILETEKQVKWKSSNLADPRKVKSSSSRRQTGKQLCWYTSSSVSGSTCHWPGSEGIEAKILRTTGIGSPTNAPPTLPDKASLPHTRSIRQSRLLHCQGWANQWAGSHRSKGPARAHGDQKRWWRERNWGNGHEAERRLYKNKTIIDSFRKVRYCSHETVIKAVIRKHCSEKVKNLSFSI